MGGAGGFGGTGAGAGVLPELEPLEPVELLDPVVEPDDPVEPVFVDPDPEVELVEVFVLAAGVIFQLTPSHVDAIPTRLRACWTYQMGINVVGWLEEGST